MVQCFTVYLSLTQIRSLPWMIPWFLFSSHFMGVPQPQRWSREEGRDKSNRNIKTVSAEPAEIQSYLRTHIQLGIFMREVWAYTAALKFAGVPPLQFLKGH